jgi:preprotein translocase subunit SecA
MSLQVAPPGPLWGTYPLRKSRTLTGQHQRQFEARSKIPHWIEATFVNRSIDKRAKNITHQLKLNSSSKVPLDARLDKLRFSLRQPNSQTIDKAILVVCLFAQHILGICPYQSQITCALMLLEQRLVELDTGEGKSLACTIAACVMALAGNPVHVITANGYLAKRDYETFEALIRQLGLTAGFATEDQPQDQQATAFQNDLVYTTARCVGFAFLRDRLANNHSRTLRGLASAIVDEADVVLLDEARTPLVLAHEVNDPAQNLRCFRAIEIARDFKAKTLVNREFNSNNPFYDNATGSQRELSKQGLEELTQRPLTPFLSRIDQYAQVKLALQALLDLHHGQHYWIKDRSIELIDLESGRNATGRQLSDGLHTMLAIKEGLPMPKQTRHAASLIYPDLFGQYHHLAGLSGTLMESRAELQKNYGCTVSRVEPNFKSQRQSLKPRFFANREQLESALLVQVKTLHERGRPVLIATQDMNQTAQIRDLCERAGLDVATLSAQNEEVEARVIARAGSVGAITIATQVAGRGTDISLPPQAISLGGLAIISLQTNRSQRTDRQVFGRCARQGQPGSVQLWIEKGQLQTFFERLPSPMTRVISMCSWLAKLPDRGYRLGQRCFYFEDRLTRERFARAEQDLSEQLIFSANQSRL